MKTRTAPWDYNNKRLPKNMNWMSFVVRICPQCGLDVYLTVGDAWSCKVCGKVAGIAIHEDDVDCVREMIGEMNGK